MADPGQLFELLRSFPFLADQPPEVVQRLASQGQLLRFSLGQPISRLEQAPSQMFFLLQGTARSVVMALRLTKGVATLQRLDAGAVMGWSGLCSTRNWETLIASTDLVVLALPHAALRQEMAVHAPLAQSIQNSVNPAELFAVLDAHLQDYPRALSHQVVEAAVALADGTRAVVITPEQLQATSFPPERLWLVASGGLPLGTALPTALPLDIQTPLRVLGLDRLALARLVDPPPVLAGDSVIAAAGWETLLLDRWEDHRQQLEDGAIADAPELPPYVDEEPDNENKRPPSSYPWHRGEGALESPIAAFRMLSDLLGLPFRRDLLRRVFTEQVKRPGAASLALAGAVAE